MIENGPSRPRRGLFALAVVGGLVLAFGMFMGLALGDCIPRDGSAAMHACDTVKHREFWLYPALVLLSLAAARVYRSSHRGGLALALVSSIVAMVLPQGIERLA